MARLGAKLRPSEELLCVAPAVHSTDAAHSRRVWLCLGRSRTQHEEYAVFLFTRTRVPFAFWREWIYCVLPVVLNVQIDIEDTRCIFSWSSKARRQRGRSSTSQSCERNNVLRGDCDIELEAEADTGGVLVAIERCYKDACDRGLLFPNVRRQNHREYWAYRDAIPLDLATLQPWGNSRHSQKSVFRARVSDSDSDQEDLRLLCITWNVGATSPLEDQSMVPLLMEQADADLVCVGFQEVCELSARRLLQDGTEWLRWRMWATTEVDTAYGGALRLLEASHLVGLLMLVFVRNCIRDQVSNICSCVIPTGVGGVGGNKGAVCTRFEMCSTSLCFVNAHLAAGQEHYIERCLNFQTIIERIKFEAPDDEMSSFRMSMKSSLSRKPSNLSDSSFDRGSVYTVHDHDHVIWIGDTNSRLHWPGKLGGMPLDKAAQLVRSGQFGELLALDQLQLMRMDGMAFDGFEEHVIHFLPSYKWRPNRDALDMRSQKHVPAWTDRILFRSTTRPVMTALSYGLFDGLKQSDHRPVYAGFAVPWDGTTEKASHNFQEAFLVMVEPAEVCFHIKPDRTHETTVRLTSRSSERLNFKMFTVESDPATGKGPAEDPHLLARWVKVTPSEGTIQPGGSAVCTVSVAVCEAILQSQEAELSLCVRVDDHDECSVLLRASLQPSIFRLPLPELAALGSQPLLMSLGGRAKRQPADGQRSGQPMPPKELMAVMQWMLQQSRDAPPGRLQWWPDPLQDCAKRGEDAVAEFLEYVENGWPLPTHSRTLVVRSAALFLLRWLSLLPEPLLAKNVVQQFGANNETDVLSAMAPLPRGVFICIVALFAHLTSRHGSHNRIMPLLASCMTQQLAPLALTQQLLNSVMPKFVDVSWPPFRALGFVP